jgi:hypothetical protein
MSTMMGTAFLAASYPPTADGVWYFHVRAVDALGVGGLTMTRSVRIDATAPVTSEAGADAAWHNSDVHLAFSPSDAASGVASTEYKVGSGSWTTGTSVIIPATPDGSNDGPHVVSYRSTDVAGNVETAKSCTVNIDAGTPTTTVTGADDAWRNSDMSLSFSGNDAGPGVASTQYKVDGAAWTIGDSVVVPATAGDGAHAVLYRSTDALGHAEAPKSCAAKIDTTPRQRMPPVSATSGPPATCPWPSRPTTPVRRPPASTASTAAPGRWGATLLSRRPPTIPTTGCIP